MAANNQRSDSMREFSPLIFALAAFFLSGCQSPRVPANAQTWEKVSDEAAALKNSNKSDAPSAQAAAVTSTVFELGPVGNFGNGPGFRDARYLTTAVAELRIWWDDGVRGMQTVNWRPSDPAIEGIK